MQTFLKWVFLFLRFVSTPEFYDAVVLEDFKSSLVEPW